jgi:hypothetical protein
MAKLVVINNVWKLYCESSVLHHAPDTFTCQKQSILCWNQSRNNTSCVPVDKIYADVDITIDITIMLYVAINPIFVSFRNNY